MASVLRRQVQSKLFSAAALRELRQFDEEAAFRAAATGIRVRAAGEDFIVTLASLQEHQLQVLYQPKVVCGTRAPAGFEALVRWVHPEQGVIMPDRFIPFAESNDLIGAVSEQVIAQALDWYARDLGAAGRDLSLSINLSARTLGDHSFVERMLAHCTEREVEPERVIFELTETAAMDDAVASLELTRLRMKGFLLSIDDFGTGYFSIVQLVRLPFSEIKIDKSFVITARSSQESRAVIRSIIELGHSLGLRSTAEGVEDAETLSYLEEIGCDFAQGFLFARPLSGADALAWLQSQA